VIEAVTGRPYIDVVATELLEPLELTDTGFSRPLTPDANIAIGYRKAHDGWRELPFSSPGAFSPIGGIFTTAHDLARWARWLASALTPDAAQPGPLSAASRREMQQINRFIPVAPTPASGEPASVRGYGYGFGLFVETDSRLGDTVFHSGGYPGFSAHMRWNQPCGIGIVAFENATYAGVSAAASRALDLAIDHVGAAALPPAPWAATTAMMPRVESLLHGWDDALADEIFAENVALDVPYAERAAAIRTVLQRVGGLEDAAAPKEPHGDSAAHLVWYLPGRNGRVCVEIRLTPTTPSLIQTLKIDAEATA
jgi:CubicO group peptidase (beta-lactamase class C family)